MEFFKRKPKARLSNLPPYIVEKHFDGLVDAFAKCKMSDNFQSNLFFKAGEKLVFDIPKIQLCEVKSGKVFGDYQEFSIRIMKRISYRFDGFQGGIERKVVPIDEGNFILTNKRIVFIGDKKSLDIPLDKILILDPLENGIAVSISGKEKAQFFVGTNVMEISMAVSPEPGEEFKEETITWKLTGVEVKNIIQKIGFYELWDAVPKE